MQGQNSSSNDFFNAPPANSTRQPPPPPAMTTGTAARRARPPAPRAGTRPTTSSSATSSYYGASSKSSAYAAAPPAAAPTRPTTAAPPTSYYGTGAPATFAASSSAPTNAGSSHTPYYAPGSTGTADGWYTGPSSSTTTQAQQQPAMTSASYRMPSSSHGQSTTIPTPMTPAAPTSGQMIGSMDGMLSGPMSSSSSSAPSLSSSSAPSTFIPRAPSDLNNNNTTKEEDYDNELPLLEELGVHVDHIFIKTRAVVLPFRRLGHVEPNLIHGSSDGEAVQELMQTADMIGPLVFALLLGGEMLLMGKLQFGYIYGFGMFGCLSMTLVLTLMKQPNADPNETAISFWAVTSILGYALLPVNLLAFLKLFLSLGKLETLNRILGLLTIAWCTVASTRLMEQGCGMRSQRYLIAYPIALLYSAFVLITVF